MRMRGQIVLATHAFWNDLFYISSENSCFHVI